MGHDGIFKVPTERVGGVPFSVTKFENAVEFCLNIAERPPATGVPVRLANSYCVALASKDRAYQEVMLGHGLNLPDGTPVWLIMFLRAALKGSTLPQRVRGPSFFVSSLEKSENSEIAHYFIGGTDESMLRMMEKMKQQFPGLRVAGWYAPPIAPANKTLFDECTERIRASGASIVWIGLGTPKQDITSSVLAEQTQTVCIGVGAAFDFFSGTVKEAPRVFRLTGSEWVFRLATEPRRLWRRYLFGNYTFLAIVLREGLFELKNKIAVRGWLGRA